MSWEQRRENRKRKMSLELDLNRDPPTEEGGTSTQQQQQQQQQLQTPTPVVNVADDDDVIESSPRSFAQAKRIAEESRRVRRRTNIVNVDLENGTRVDLQNQTTTNGNHGNVETRSSSVSENPIPEPPKEPVFNCPICMAPLVEETSTRCGHIFCKTCIRAAVSSQGKCPTCRKKVSRNSLIRVFLPAAS